MPLSENDFREPYFIRDKVRYTIAGLSNKKSIYMKFDQYPRNYRDGVFPQPGYNPHHQSTTIEKVNWDSDSITLKPR